MKKISLAPMRLLITLALVVLLIATVVPPVSAETIVIDETEFIIDDNRYEFDKNTYESGANTQTPANPFRVYFGRYQDLADVQTIFWKPYGLDSNFVLYDENISSESYNILVKASSEISGLTIGSGTLTYYKGPTTSKSHVRIDIDNINTSLMSAYYTYFLIDDAKPNNLKYVYGQTSNVGLNYVRIGDTAQRGTAEIEYFTRFTNTISLEDYDSTHFTLKINRDGIKQGSTYGRHSVVSIYDNGGNMLYTNTDSSTVITNVAKNLQPYTVIVESTAFDGKTYTGYLGSGEPWIPPGEEPTPIGEPTHVTVYVRDSQTYALIANAHINISANVNGNFHEIVNKTLPSGIYSSELQPTGGGMPNPDFYRLITTVEGYNSIMPYIDFEVGGETTIYAILDPIGGAPEDENNTFIDFFVRDLSANPISGATVNFGGYTLITNSAGYTIFEVEKDKTYSWTVSKSGYGSLTGNTVIGSNTRHTINTVIAPAVTPTKPTAIPTSTPISPTPTMTAPTGEPVSNLLEWFAAHFGMVLGGGTEIGKIFMWLCFAVPVGVYVGKEAKAGAAGFMGGAGIVTLFFVLIGWVPIWLLVLLALIIGLLYAKIINNPDNGGGR